MPTLNARLITRNDWDFKWEESTLVLQPGELAISIPTREAQPGETPIEGSVRDGNTGRVADTTKDPIIKIGNRDTFYTNGVINGSNGVLVHLAESGSFSDSQAQPVTVTKDLQTGKTVISVREAKATATDQQTGLITDAQSGVLTAEDYRDFSNLTDFFRDSQGNITTESITEKTMAGLKIDDSLEFDANNENKLGVSANIIWQCNE